MNPVGSQVTLVTKNPLWIMGLVVTLIVIFLHTLLAISFLKYVLQSKRETAAKKTFQKQGRAKIKKCAIAAVLLPYFRYASTLGMVWVSLETDNDSGCNIARCVGLLTYVSAITPCYLFLWLRQRLFYNHPLLVVSFGSCANYLSLAALVLHIVVGATMASVSTILPYVKNEDVLKASINGCVAGTPENSWFYMPILYGCTLFVLQGILLGLFMYPLNLHYKTPKMLQKVNMQHLRSKDNADGKDYGAVKRNSNSAEVGRGKNEKPNSQSIEKTFVKDEIRPIILKNAGIAAVSMSSDVIAMTYAGALFPHGAPQVITYSVFDLSLLVDTIAIVGSFSKWKALLFPCATQNASK